MGAVHCQNTSQILRGAPEAPLLGDHLPAETTSFSPHSTTWSTPAMLIKIHRFCYVASYIEVTRQLVHVHKYVLTRGT